MNWFESDVRDLERRLAARPLPPAPVVFYGSSSIRLWDTLAQDLPGVSAVNLGFGGSTLEACAWYFERLVPRCAPASLVLYAGDNDLGDGRPPAAVEAALLDLLRQAERRLGSIPLAFIGIKPSPSRWDLAPLIRQANQMAAAALGRLQNGVFVEVFDAMLDAGGRPDPALFAADGLHLSPAGYQLWARLLQDQAPWVLAPV